VHFDQVVIPQPEIIAFCKRWKVKVVACGCVSPWRMRKFRNDGGAAKKAKGNRATRTLPWKLLCAE
jgi:hypothetical protein